MAPSALGQGVPGAGGAADPVAGGAADPVADGSVLAELRALLDAARDARAAGDPHSARERIGDARLLCEDQAPRARADAPTRAALAELGRIAHELGDWSDALFLRRCVLEALEALEALETGDPPDPAELGRARLSLASSLCAAGELEPARLLEEQVLAGEPLAFLEELRALQRSRQELGLALYAAGELRAALAHYERALHVLERILPPEHPELLTALRNASVVRYASGDLHGARELGERALHELERRLAPDDPELATMRQNHAATLLALGELERARTLFEAVLASRAGLLGPEHPDTHSARLNLAATLRSLGDPRAARALEEPVLRSRAGALPPDHPELQAVRGNLALSLKALGELREARKLEELVLEARERTLPAGSLELLRARVNLGSTVFLMGDLLAARALEESAVDGLARLLPPEHPELQAARMNLAATRMKLGEHEAARALFEEVLEICERSLAPDHRDAQAVRLNLAQTLLELGEGERALELQRTALASLESRFPPEHRDVQAARQNHVTLLAAVGQHERAANLLEEVLALHERNLDPDHPHVQRARSALALLLARLALDDAERAEELRGRCAALLRALCASQARVVRTVLLSSSTREAEQRCAEIASDLGTLLSFAEDRGALRALEDAAELGFVLSESTRGAALASAYLARQAGAAAEGERLRAELAAAGEELASLARAGAGREEYHRARARREKAERALLQLSGSAPSALDFLPVTPQRLAARLGQSDAYVAYRRHALPRSDGAGSVERLCAFVLRPCPEEGARLALVQLGELVAIDAALSAWRAAIAAGEQRGVAAAAEHAQAERARGEELRRLVLDPLLAEIGGCERWIVALDDLMHLVPLDALPLGDDRGLVGDRWRIETRSAAFELLLEPERGTERGALVALGGAAFNSAPAALEEVDLSALEGESGEGSAPQARSAGAVWERAFAPLTHSGLEARELAALFEELFEAREPVLLLEKRRASRAALEAAAPRARWLHVATHGWFAPESIRSWDEEGGLALERLSSADVVRGMSPMLLCGLALAGANLPADVLGREPGLVTAEELSTLDLSGCELAVLSACDTNVGERRAGQGVASLQKALHMAGAKSAITSLWKVPDEATRELMLDFYRRLWVEGKPKGRALWEAKRRLHDARDERGAPRYATRDWAAWVLSGAPD